MSGALAQWRKRAIDFKMAGVMLGGGIVGTVVGVWLFALMRRQGQMDLIVSLTYVMLLGTIGGIMLRESLATLQRLAQRHHAVSRRAGQSRLDPRPAVQDALPPVAALYQRHPAARDRLCGRRAQRHHGHRRRLHHRAGHDLLLRMPTNVVMGTSLVQIIAVTAITTVLQATSNYAVDIVLAVLLVIGGVVGAQFGVRAGAKLRGEQLRLLLALLVLAVARGPCLDWWRRPPMSIPCQRGGAMKRLRLLLLASCC